MTRFLIFLGLFNIALLQAQSQTLIPAQDSTALQSNNLYLGVRDLAFVKNNEYFNLIADGYTLLGNQIDLELKYQPDSHYQLTAGVSLQKYFGRPDIEQPVPYFGLKIYQGRSQFYIGKLYTADRHQLADEIYGFERLLDERHIENGLQHRFKNKHWQTDTWLEWEHFIFKRDTLRERLNFGQTTTYCINLGQWQIRVPLQLYLMHRGGQINLRTAEDHSKNNAMVISNFLGGIRLQYQFNKAVNIGFDYAYLGSAINSDNTEELHFKSGYAHRFRLLFNYKHWQNYAGYWQGHRFVSPKGNDMFQSVSRRVNKYLNEAGEPVPTFNNHTEPDRKLLTWTTRFQKDIYPQLHLGFAIDLYYQLNSSEINTTYYSSEIDHQFDYAMGLYLTYLFDFKLKKVK